MNATQISKFISKLPNDIENLIYFDYVEPDMIMTELKKILNSYNSKNLYHKSLYHYLKNIILKNDIVVSNLINNDKIFKQIYDKHIIKGEKNFILIEDPIESMALSWLMYLYH